MEDSRGGSRGDGDEGHAAAGFGDLYDQRHRGVLAFFYRRTRCPHTSEDLTSETFAEAWACLDRYDPARGAPMPWVLGIARNLHRRWLRHGRVATSARGRIGVADLAEDDLERVDRMVDVAAARASVAAALSGLSPTMHDAVVLRVMCELPYDEVARRLGCSPGAARVRVSRALEHLSSELEPPS